MKPEMLQSMLQYYIQEKSIYDEVDGSGDEAYFDELESRPCRGVLNLNPQSSYAPGHSTFTVPAIENLNIHSHASYSPLQSPVPSPPVASLSLAQRAKVAFVGRKICEFSTQWSSSIPEKSLLKFKESCVFVSPQDKTVTLHVVPFANSLDRDLKVKWKTVDKTAISGTHYVKSEGELMFDKHSVEKEIVIKLIPPSNEDNELRFHVELEIEGGLYNPGPITVNIKNTKNFYDDEKQVFNNIMQSACTSVADVGYILNDCLNQRTFYTALSYVCSQADSLPLQVTFAFELCRLCMHRMRSDSMLTVLKEYFRNDDEDSLLTQSG